MSPSELSVEITRVPGQEVEARKFQVSLSCLNPPEEVQCSLTTDQPWLQVGTSGEGGDQEGNALKCGQSFTLSVIPAPELPEGDYAGTVAVTCNNIAQYLTVFLRLREEIANQLIISPSFLEVKVAKFQLLPKTFTVKVQNANPEGKTFTWRAESEASWLKIIPSQGMASSAVGETLSLKVDPRGLPAGGYEGTVRFFSDLDETSATEGINLTVKLEILPWQTFEVFPGSLFWSFEKTETGLTGTVFPQRLHIYAAPEGWSVSTDVSWITLSSLWPGEGEAPEGYLEISPVREVLENLPLGRHEGHVFVTDREGGLLRAVPVVVEIRPAGRPVTLPVAAPVFSQRAPDFVRVEAVETNRLHLRLPAATPPEDAEACSALEGRWENGRCHYRNRVYLVMEAPHLWPGKTFAWRPTEGRFIPIEENGVPVPEADDLYVTLGPVGEISFGPVQLLGLSGEVFWEVKVGPSYTRSHPLQFIELQVYTPQGDWRITDYYQGEAYLHPDLLSFWRSQTGWQACWKVSGLCTTEVLVTPGDGKTFFYKLEFRAGGYWFEYLLEKLSATEMEGRWRFFDGKNWSNWERFSGERPLFSF